VAPPENVTLLDEFPSLSPDGERVAFFGLEPDGKQRLWVRPLASLTAEPVPGAEGGNSPFWSPDSRSIGFFTAGKLKKVDLHGGSNQILCDASNSLRAGGTWSQNGIILFNSFDRQGLYRIAAAGGEASAVTTLDSTREDRFHVWPQFLPDGRHFLYFVQSARPENTGIYIGSLDSKESRQLVNANAKPVYTRSSSGIGYLLFAQQTTLMAQRFDDTRLKLVGEPFSIAEQVWLPNAPARGYAAFSASANGVVAYRTGGSMATELIWFDRQGRRLGTLGVAGAYSTPALSRDEKKLVVCRLDLQLGTRDLWLFDLVRGTSSRLTFDPAEETNPLWSPDGSRVAFSSSSKGTMDIYQKAATGAGDAQLLRESRDPKITMDWSPDGRYILYASGNRNWALPLEGERKPIDLSSISRGGNPRISPNGRWVAYVSIESGRREVHVQNFPLAEGRWQVSTTGGMEPSWRADGKELFYLLGEKLMAVDVKTDSQVFESGTPKPLFDVRLQTGSWRTRYQVAANGQRFLVNVPLDVSSPSPITVVLNWASEGGR
jgi:Tol biopolymer transport system component